MKTVVVGPFQCNCAILACARTREAVIIDPGDEPSRIRAAVEGDGLKVKALLHTHAHLDHVGASAALRGDLDSPILLHPGDRWLYEHLPMQGAMFGLALASPRPVDEWLEDGREFVFGSFRLTVIHTPGHSPGSVCFRIADGPLFSGDTLFAGSVGRTDLWGGSWEELMNSIHGKILPLPDETPVFPGHGPESSIGRERRSNPFLQT